MTRGGSGRERHEREEAGRNLRVRAVSGGRGGGRKGPREGPDRGCGGGDAARVGMVRERGHDGRGAHRAPRIFFYVAHLRCALHDEVIPRLRTVGWSCGRWRSASRVGWTRGLPWAAGRSGRRSRRPCVHVLLSGAAGTRFAAGGVLAGDVATVRVLRKEEVTAADFQRAALRLRGRAGGVGQAVTPAGVRRGSRGVDS